MTNTLVGGAIGDALGKFAESKLPNYQPLLDWDGKTFLPSEHHGLAANAYTDDGQMSIMVAESLINKGFNPDDLAIRYVDWIVSKRARGWGKTTMAAVQNLIAGKHWSESGIADSYGNGTAMRAAPFGIWFRNGHLPDLIEACRIDAYITHASQEAVAGSIAVALAAYYAVRQETQDLLDKIDCYLPDSKVKIAIHGLQSLVESPHIAPSSALAFLGTRADVRMTVPSALYLFCKMKNHQEAVIEAIRAGGDTDTLASIVGALFGAKDGIKGILPVWVEQIEDRSKLLNLDSQLYHCSNKSFLKRDDI